MSMGPSASQAPFYSFGHILKRPLDRREEVDLLSKTDSVASNSGAKQLSKSCHTRPERAPEKHGMTSGFRKPTAMHMLRGNRAKRRREGKKKGCFW